MALKIPPLFLTLIFMWLAWLLAQLLPDAALVVPLQLSLLLAMAGVVICGAGVVQFRRLGTTMNPIDPTRSSLLVTTGIYRLSRNPMYLGFLFLLMAWSLYLGWLTALLVPLIFVLYMNRFQISIEEQALASRYGDTYRNYMGRVRRWL